MAPLRSITIAAAATAALLALTACSGAGESAATTEGGDRAEITIALPPGGWPEGDAASYLWANLLEKQGYDVTLEAGGDMAVIYTALAGGDHDLFLDAWLPVTHEAYFDEHGDELERLGAWYDDARLTIAVTKDADVTSIGDLATRPEAVGGRLVGIEPGAGLTRITKETVIPTYGLDALEFVESSTPAMLAELSGAVDEGRPIAVTLWRPHWAYDAFPLRDLEDPEGTLGGAETIEAVGRSGFAEDYPQLAGWLADFRLTGDQLFSLENLMFNVNEGEDNEGSVVQWLDENPGVAEQLTAS